MFTRVDQHVWHGILTALLSVILAVVLIVLWY